MTVTDIATGVPARTSTGVRAVLTLGYAVIIATCSGQD
jgi:hypothetical protein